jgi:exocyst complex protein 7
MSSIEEQQKLLWLEEQLLEEVEKTERLKQMLGRADYLTGQLVFLLDSFDQRIANLSTTIAPIHDLTQRLTYRNQNIDETVENLGKVIGYFNLPNDLKQTIRMGSIGEDLDGYLVKVDKLFEAVTFITKSRLKSGEKVVVQLRTLHTDATNRLETEFRSALEKVSQVFDILVFHNEEKNTKFEAPVINDEETLNNLKKLAKYLQEAPAFKEEASDFTEIFVDVRSNYLKKIFEPLARESSVVEKVKKKGKTSDIYEKGSHPYIFYMTSLLVMLQVNFDLL